MSGSVATMPEGDAAGPISVVLVDEPAIRRGVRMLLELDPNVVVLGEAGDGATAVSLLQTLHPDIVLIDPVLPGLDGPQAADLRAVAPDSALIILSLRDDAAIRARVRDSGAAAFVDKHDACDSLLCTIRRVAAQIRARQA